MFKKVEQRVATFSPTAVGTNQNRALFKMAKGERVIAASAEVLRPAAAATTPTLTLGDGTAVAGLVTTTDLDLELAAQTLANGSGSFLANSGGKLYAVADTIDADYIAGATPGAVAPSVRFTIHVIRERN